MNSVENIAPHSLDHLDLLARQVVEGFIIGLHKSPFHGFSVEFAEHRLYNPGEATRNIDWKVYARTDKLFTKRFEEETNLRCQIVVDTSTSMYFPESEKGELMNKINFSAVASASLMHLLKKQRDAYGLSLFNETLYVNTPCKSSTTHYKLLMSHLDLALNQKSSQRKTSAAQALHQIAESIHKRSMVIIFSDMFDQSEDPQELFSALQHLKHNKHEVILFHVVDKKLEVDFAYENRPYLFVDLETGEEVRLQSNQVKDHYISQIKKYKDELRMKCLQYKIEVVEADIREGYFKILQSYLVKRARMKV